MNESTAGILELAHQNTIEQFDNLGCLEAEITGKPILIGKTLEIIPSNLEIWNTTQGGDVHDWWKFIIGKANRWDISVRRIPNKSLDLSFSFPTNDCIRKKDDLLYDSRYVELDESGQPVLHEDSIKEGWRIEPLTEWDWRPDIPDLDDNHVFRGMNDDEMRATVINEFVQSRGDIVAHIGEHTNNVPWTFFYEGSHGQGSFWYAAFGRGFSMATFTRPAYVVSLKRTGDIIFDEEHNKTYSEIPIPFTQVQRIYEIRPVTAKGSLSIPLHRIEHEHFGLTYLLGNMNTEAEYPIVKYIYKEVSVEEVKLSLNL